MVYEVERRADLKRFAVKAFSKTQASIKKNGMDHLINEISVLKNLNH
jgi:putative ubiquitin-RnfH superfamily antitoxin RatB of RatAB toxin-antitoxin module